MIFYYVRHGEPIYDPDSLTEYGEKQAYALAKRFAVTGLDEIYSSSSNRAVQTARPTCELLKKEPVLLDWAQESLAWEEFTVEKDGRRTWVYFDRKCIEKFRSTSGYGLGEDWVNCEEVKETQVKKGIKRINEETDAFFLRLGFKHDRIKGGYEVLEPNEKRIALFAHQGFGLAFLSSLLDIPYPIFTTRFDMGHTGVTVIYFDDKKEFTYPKILQLSNDSHLYKEGILAGYQGKIDV